MATLKYEFWGPAESDQVGGHAMQTKDCKLELIIELIILEWHLYAYLNLRLQNARAMLEQSRGRGLVMSEVNKNESGGRKNQERSLIQFYTHKCCF